MGPLTSAIWSSTRPTLPAASSSLRQLYQTRTFDCLRLALGMGLEGLANTEHDEHLPRRNFLEHEQVRHQLVVAADEDHRQWREHRRDNHLRPAERQHRHECLRQRRRRRHRDRNRETITSAADQATTPSSHTKATDTLLGDGDNDKLDGRTSETTRSTAATATTTSTRTTAAFRPRSRSPRRTR